MQGKRISADEGTSFLQKLLTSKYIHFYDHFILEIINQTIFSIDISMAIFFVNSITFEYTFLDHLNQVFSCYLFTNSSFRFQYTFCVFNQFLLV